MNNFKLALKIENTRFIRSKKPFLLLCGVILILSLNFVLEQNIDGNVDTNVSVLNYYQTFTQFIYIILAIVCGSSLSSDKEKKYINFYRNIKINSFSLFFSKLIISVFYSVVIVLLPFIFIMIFKNLNLTQIFNISLINVGIITIILLFQYLISLLFEKNIYALISIFVGWIILNIVNVIPFLKGMVSPIDNNSYVHHFVSSLLNVESHSLLYEGLLEITNYDYIKLYSYLSITTFTLVVVSIIVIKWRKHV